MEYILTICSQDKSLSTQPLPAYRRYLSPRIAQLKSESEATGIPALILSGKFGLVGINDLLPYYNHPLHPGEVGDLVPLVTHQLKGKPVTKITAYMKSRQTDGWEPYYQLLESATQAAGVQLEYKIINL